VRTAEDLGAFSRPGWAERLDVRSLATAATFAVTISIYSMTLLRGVSSFDSAEMQTVPPTLGIAHPTGYPLWTILGFTWTRLPISSPALMMNLLSAILFALVAATLTLISMRLGVRPLLACVAAVSFAFAGETWARATQAEVHSLHTLLMALFLLAWITAEQTGSRRAALAMIGLTAVGLTHHRLMAITAPPVLLWFFARNLGMLRSRTFALDAVLCALTPLLVYAYVPIRAGQDPRVVNSDMSGGAVPIIRGDVFASHEHAFAAASPGNWWRALPTYGDLGVRWLGWPVAILAVVGTICLLRGRWPILVGLALIVFASTWGLANRTDLDYRWLIMPLFVCCLLAAVGLEALVSLLGRTAGERGLRRESWIAAAALLIPLGAVASHYSSYDRSGDRRDLVNGERILSALPSHSVIWSYWDVRTTLQYLVEIENLRPDVTVLDHRAYGKYGTGNDVAVALGVAADPALAGRPLYYLPSNDQERQAVARRYTLRPAVKVEIPYGFDDRRNGWLFAVRR